MKIRDYAIRTYESRFGRLIMHVLFWLFLFGLRCYINNISINPYKDYGRGIVLSSFYGTITVVIVYYLLVDLVYEKLYRHKKYLLAAVAFLVLIIVYSILNFAMEKLLLSDPVWDQLVQKNAPAYYLYLQKPFLQILFSRIVSLGVVYQLGFDLALPLFVRVMLAYNKGQLQSSELARQNVELEFNFLKSQVNPHFLHNTLNNIYSLIIHDRKEQAATMVARLSAFMRYSMHDAGMERQPVEREVQLMQDYIELEKVRLNYTSVQQEFNTDSTAYSLPPLLFLPLIENAFKYGVDRQGSLITILFSLVKGTLHFQCSNHFDQQLTDAKKSGIGVRNVQKRLAQYYPGKHSYAISTVNDVYSVNLSITLV